MKGDNWIARVKAEPDYILVGNETKNSAPNKMRVKDMFKVYRETFPFDQIPWRKGKLAYVKKHLIGLNEKSVNYLTAGALAPILKHNRAAGLISDFLMILKFICDGTTITYSKKYPKELSISSFTNGKGEETLGIRPIQMSLEDAITMVKTSRSIYGEIIENILHDLRVLPKGTPYPFNPSKTLPPNKLTALRTSIQKAIMESKLDFVSRTVESKNIVVIFHRSDLEEGWTKRRNIK